MATPKKPEALQAVLERIRDAEKKQQPIGRETIGMGSEEYENLALLIERGFGKKPDVLRQALAIGLRTWKKGTDPDDALPPEDTIRFDDVQGERAGFEVVAVEPLSPPITTPLSVQRRIADGEIAPEETDDEEEE